MTNTSVSPHSADSLAVVHWSGNSPSIRLAQKGLHNKKNPSLDAAIEGGEGTTDNLLGEEGKMGWIKAIGIFRVFLPKEKREKRRTIGPTRENSI